MALSVVGSTAQAGSQLAVSVLWLGWLVGWYGFMCLVVGWR